MVGWVVAVVVHLMGFLGRSGGWLLVADSGLILSYEFNSHRGCSVWWVF